MQSFEPNNQVEFLESDQRKYNHQRLFQAPPKRGFLIKLVIKLSGGKITTTKEALIILFAISLLFLGFSMYMITQSKTKSNNGTIKEHQNIPIYTPQ